MRVAIVGTGGIAAVHARALHALGHTVAAVVSRTQAGADTFAQAHASACAMATTRLETALAFGVDAVHICTPPALHGAAIRLDSAEGQGTTITVRFPAAPVSKRAGTSSAKSRCASPPRKRASSRRSPRRAGSSRRCA